jgi:hypothetical protein
MRDRKRPQDFLPAARALIERQRDNPPSVAHLDQIEAAHSEADEILRSIERYTGEPYQCLPSSPRTVAWSLAVQAACERNIKRSCDHIDGSPRLILASVTFGIVGCEHCFGRMMRHARVVDPQHCDVCNTPSRVFSEVVTNINGRLVMVNVCRSCRSWSESNEMTEVTHKYG